jgi:uncharacterized protein involved in propanediol utilization
MRFVLGRLKSNSFLMVRAVSDRPLTAVARVLARDSPCGICGGRSGTGTGIIYHLAVE